MSSLVQRVLAAVVAVPLLLLLTFRAPLWLFDLVVALVLWMALAEWFRLASARLAASLSLLGSLALILLLAAVPGEAYGFGFRAASACAVMLLVTGFMLTDRPLSDAAVSLSQTAFGVFYLGALGSYVLLLRGLEHGAWALLLLYVSTWAYDTGGYFTGRFLGRHKMTPNLSPKKTWEGFAGGLLLCVVAVNVLLAYSPWGDMAPWARVALGALLAVWGQTGDLAESLLKRSLDAKDSGVFLPGHGGVLDRIDSLLFNAPLVYAALWAYQACPCLR
jgi:phosphatidate cytidylyltransferase